MPTDEFKKLLDREFSKAAVQPIVEIASPLLRELVNAEPGQIDIVQQRPFVVNDIETSTLPLGRTWYRKSFVLDRATRIIRLHDSSSRSEAPCSAV